MKIALFIVAALSIFPVSNLIFLGIGNLQLGLNDQISMAELGQLGDFFGGHTAAFTSTLSLLVVLFFTHHQAQQQADFFQKQRNEENLRTSRSFFLEGVGLITQWDIASPGCDQCLRLLDYYSRLAIKSGDGELLLILNTVITAQIRANLQGKNGSFKKTNYPFACEALELIAESRKREGLALKAKREAKE